MPDVTHHAPEENTTTNPAEVDLQSFADYVEAQATKMGLQMEETERFELDDGTVEWRCGAKGDPTKGVLHHKDGPAVIRPNGTEEWWLYNLVHREGDEPAIARADGYKAHFTLGRLHREEGPAIETAKGGTAYYFNGKPHRTENQPAITTSQGRELYFEEGKAHRTDGPVLKTEDREVWKQKGLLHRLHTEGPAFQSPSETIYALYGFKHNDTGPAHTHGPEGIHQDHYLYGVKLYPSKFRKAMEAGTPAKVATSMAKNGHPEVLSRAALVLRAQGEEKTAKRLATIAELILRSERDAGRF